MKSYIDEVCGWRRGLAVDGNRAAEKKRFMAKNARRFSCSGGDELVIYSV